MSESFFFYNKNLSLNPVTFVKCIQIKPAYEFEFKSCCRPRELVSFVHLRESYSFDARHVTRSRPIENSISVGGQCF